MKILVTGANGMVGRVVCMMLEQLGHEVVRIVRTSSSANEIAIGDLNATTQWGQVLDPNIDVVIHLAAKISDEDRGLSNRFYEVNTLGTENLARECVSSGIKRFVFVSTIKVLGGGQSQPYCPDDPAMPEDAYAMSKWMAEQALWQIAESKEMEVVIIRPPVVYGPRVKGNFLSLLQAVNRHLPLPFGLIQNQRSLVYVGNLADAICFCAASTSVNGKTFLVSDREDVSTPELIRRIGFALNREPLLLSIPLVLMRYLSALIGKNDSMKRLEESFAVNIDELTKIGWVPKWGMKDGLEDVARWINDPHT